MVYDHFWQTEKMTVGNLLGHAAGKVSDEGQKHGQSRHPDRGADDLEQKMGDGGPFATHVRHDGGHEGRHGSAHIGAEDHGQGIVQGNETLLPQNDEDAYGDGRGVDQTRE